MRYLPSANAVVALVLKVKLPLLAKALPSKLDAPKVLPPAGSCSAYRFTITASAGKVPVMRMDRFLPVMLSVLSGPQSSLAGMSSAVTAVGSVASMESRWIAVMPIEGVLVPVGVYR